MATVTVGGFYLVKNSGFVQKESVNPSSEDSQSSAQPSTIQKSNRVSTTLDFATLQAFKNGKGGDCAKKLFGVDGISFGTLGTQIGDNNKLSATEFTSSGAEANSSKSCLVINWERTNYSVNNDTKWKGYFRWSWSFINGNKGFIVFVTTKSSSLSLEGGFYLLENSSSWQVTKYKELGNNSSITRDDLDKRIPKLGTVVSLTSQSGFSTDYWGFVSGSDDIGKFCTTQSDDCTSTSTSPSLLKKSWMWEFNSKSTTSKLVDWTNNFEDWLEGLFNKEQLQIKNSLSDFTGTWEPSVFDVAD